MNTTIRRSARWRVPCNWRFRSASSPRKRRTQLFGGADSVMGGWSAFHQISQVFQVAAGVGLDITGGRRRFQIGETFEADVVDGAQNLGQFDLPFAKVTFVL